MTGNFRDFAAAMRSPRMAAAAAVLLGSVPLALGVAIGFGAGAEPVVHFALGLTFVLIAFGVFDFELPHAISVAAAMAAAALAAIFLLQGASDLAPSEPLRHLAFNVLGQRMEKLLGYMFLLWCACLLLMASAGATRLLGVFVLAAVLGAEAGGLFMAATGREAHGALKLLYLPVFAWLLLESVKRSQHRKVQWLRAQLARCSIDQQSLPVCTLIASSETDHQRKIS